MQLCFEEALDPFVRFWHIKPWILGGYLKLRMQPAEVHPYDQLVGRIRYSVSAEAMESD